MITVVNEPLAGYKATNWKIASLNVFPIDESIFRMDDDSVYIRPPSYYAHMIFSDKPKRRLSMLRGKMKKQTEKEIDDQISDLRNEWDRNI